MTSQEESDEEYLDDPIRLIDLEQERVSGILHSHTDAKEITNATISVDLTDSGDEAVAETRNPLIKKVASKLPVTFFTIPRNVHLFNNCRDLCIKVVNCVEHPGYYKKHFKTIEKFTDDEDISFYKSNCIEEYDLDTDEEINVEDNRDLSYREISKIQNGNISNETPTSEEESFIMPAGNGQTGKPKIRPVDITPYLSNNPISYTSGAKKSHLQTKSSREHNEKQKALCQKNESQIDIKKNQGLIGLKISHVVVAENTISNTKRVRKDKRQNKLSAEEKRCESIVNPEVIVIENEKMTNSKDKRVPYNAEDKKFPKSVLSSKDLKHDKICKMIDKSEKHILNLNRITRNVVAETPKLNTLIRPVTPEINCTEHVSAHTVLHCEKDIQNKNKSPRSLIKEQKHLKHSDDSKTGSNLKSCQNTYTFTESSPHSTSNGVKDNKKTNKFLNDQLKARAKSIKETATNSEQKSFNVNAVQHLTSNESTEQNKKKLNDYDKLNDIVIKHSLAFVNKDNSIPNSVLNKPNSNNKEHIVKNSVQNNSNTNHRNFGGFKINCSFFQSSGTKQSQSDLYNKISKELSKPKKRGNKVKTKYSKQKSVDGIAKIMKPAHKSTNVQSSISTNVKPNGVMANRPNTDLQNVTIQNEKKPSVGDSKLNSFYVEKTASVTPTIPQQEIFQDNYHIKYGIPPNTSISVQDKPNVAKKGVTSNNKDDNNPAKLSSSTTAINAPPLTDVSQPNLQNYDNVGYMIKEHNDRALKFSTATVKKQTGIHSLENKNNSQSKNCHLKEMICINNQFYSDSNNLNQEVQKHNVAYKEPDSCHTKKTVIGSNLSQINNPSINRNIPVSNYSGGTNKILIIRNDPPTLPNSEYQLNAYQDNKYIQNQGLPIPVIRVNNQRVKIGQIAPVKQNLRAIRKTNYAVPDYSNALCKNYINNCNPIYRNLINMPPHGIGMDYVENNNSYLPYLYPPPHPPPPTNLPHNINQPVFAPQNAQGATIIGMNESGVVRKINIAAMPGKNSRKTTQQYNINHPDNTPVNTKNEMLKELSKMPIFEDSTGNNLKRPFPEAVRHPELSKILSKQPKLESMLPKSGIVSENNFTTPVIKGYSPPILPIPTYEKTFEILCQDNVLESQIGLKKSLDIANVPRINVNPNKRPLFSLDTKDKSVKKISLDEYKKRVIRNDGTLTDRGFCRADRIKIDSAKDEARHNSELDLGYDSDTTVKM